MKDNLLIHLAHLTDLSGAPGFEDQVRNYLKKVLEKCGIKDIFVDGLGNLICMLQGTDPKAKTIHFDAHMDEPAFMVKYIDPKGFIYITPLGYFSDIMVLGQRVVICTPKGDVPGVFCVKSFHMKDGKNSQTIDIEDLWVDIGACSEQEVKELGIRPGRAATFLSPFTRLGNNLVMAKAIDNRGSLCSTALRHEGSVRKPTQIYCVLLFFGTGGISFARGAYRVPSNGPCF